MFRSITVLFAATIVSTIHAQDYYAMSKECFDRNQIDSARWYINRTLGKNPTAEDFFLSALIHEANDKPLRAVADYEAAIQRDPENLEAYFQKGLIYFNASSHSQAIEDFTYVIDNIDGSHTRAIYFGSDLHGTKGTFMSTLQSMKGRVFQYRGLAYQESEKWKLAEKDFDYSLQYDSTADVFINRSLLYQKRGETTRAINDLNLAIKIDPTNYLAWYNLVLLSDSVLLPSELIDDETFTPMMNLFGANAYESNEYEQSIIYYSKALAADNKDDLALIGRGKAYLRTQAYANGRSDFLKALQLNPERSESLFLVGNSFFYEQAYEQALGFYEQYLSIDRNYANVWYNAAMSYLSISEKEKGCICLERASELGMDRATEGVTKYCTSQ